MRKSEIKASVPDVSCRLEIMFSFLIKFSAKPAGSSIMKQTFVLIASQIFAFWRFRHT